jgi:hypothetical protein
MRDFSNVRNDNFFTDLSNHVRLMDRMRGIAGEDGSTEQGDKAAAASLYAKTYTKSSSNPAAQSVLIAIATTLKTQITLPNGRVAGPPARVPIAA